ncbi:F1F0 ATP synthase subunit e, mitochondrial [Dimargaris cristalligena]|uniref:ATP synthase F(0) complex subunit e, mitochondrial n=1 Tax=Dimargaris cristalligena TaxID=215637 RepID=A0A4P9ZPZ7_9FUNG|nr:F1F0 ATP synthase subunit e, mitochondrial [Dimargaris cristalligena]RKP35536.1 putative ATP synthase subunit E, mitochondrial [Dimargaris cristalligena]|eukprot:RKP35536.1 putative ATP synthase subunit E, mitochondrial [Dimargaris cristalligena]
MTSPLVKYLRYGALASGLVYGYVHNNTLLQNKGEEAKREEYRHYENLIAKAKNEYAQLKAAQSTAEVISDPENPQFDLEKYLNYVDSSSKA